jgi:hypothetical protein
MPVERPAHLQPKAFVVSGRDHKRIQLAADYYVTITAPGPKSKSWGWEIHRRSMPLKDKPFRVNLRSAAEAKADGKRALNELLDRMVGK